MLNRASAPPYGFDIDLLHGGAILILSTPEFPCAISDPAHCAGGDALVELALAFGLHYLHAADTLPPNSTQPWTFVLPTQARQAGLFGPRNTKLMADAVPEINHHWFDRAVMAGGRCRLITTSGLLAQATTGKIHPETIRAQGGQRLVGATINVEF